MIERTQAIVLNRIKYSDSGIIVNLYSKKYGRIACMVKSCHSKKSNAKANIFFPLNILELDIYYKERREIQIIKNAQSIAPLISITTDILKNCISQFIVEIIQKSVKEESENTELFNFLSETVLSLETNNNSISNFHIIFMISLSKILGFSFSNNFCESTNFANYREGMFLPFFTSEEEALNEKDSFWLNEFMQKDYSNFFNINIPYNNRKNVLLFLVKYYNYHILHSKEIQSLNILQEIFSND